MPPPKIRALSIIQDAFAGRWHARGDVDGVGRLDAWGDTLLEAMEALRTRAAEEVARQEKEGSP